MLELFFFPVFNGNPAGPPLASVGVGLAKKKEIDRLGLHDGRVVEVASAARPIELFDPNLTRL